MFKAWVGSIRREFGGSSCSNLGRVLQRRVNARDAPLQEVVGHHAHDVRKNDGPRTHVEPREYEQRFSYAVYDHLTLLLCTVRLDAAACCRWSYPSGRRMWTAASS